MKKLNTKILMSVISVLLIAAMALGFSACGNKDADKQNPPVKTEDSTEIGQGQRSFLFEVRDKDGSAVSFLIKTDRETVGEALLDNALIAGADSEYGLMVDTVNGVKYDYTADKMYWAFYENGAYAQKGVDQTPIDESAVYSFVATKA